MSRARGNAAEEVAIAYLKGRGCRILARNFYFKGGEIDIIAEKEGVIHFVEVKSGATFEPAYAITPAKIARIVRGAQIWIKKNGHTGAWQLDALIVRGDRCEWLENITI